MITCHASNNKNIPDTVPAAVTVFFALISAIIIALLLMILESARTEGGRLYMTIAANSAIDSEFSQYHKKLWEKYRLLGLEHYAYDQLTDEMQGFLSPYLDAENWYPMRLDSIEISGLALLTAEDGAYYEQEVLDYMKYGIAASVWDLLEANTFADGIRDGSAVNRLSDLYDDHAKEAVKLEKAIDEIGKCLQSLRSHRDSAAAHLADCQGNAFIVEAAAMQTELEKIPRLVKNYLRQAEAMETGLQASRARLNAERDSGELSAESWNLLDADISEYESYVSEDGERRQEISGFPERAENGIRFLDALIAEAEDIEQYIEDWEPSDDEEDDELDIEALWAPVRAEFAAFDLITLGVPYGIADEETERKLEDIQTLLNGSFLRLVLPAGEKPDTAEKEMGEKPSEICWSGISSTTPDLLDRLFLAEYTAGVMDYFGRGSYDSGSRKNGSGTPEIEYILFGKGNDTDNLTAVVKRLIEIRTGLNLIYLYSDSTRRSEARTLALAITGALGLTPLGTVATFFIMSVWALGQAVCDVRDLLAGGKVPFLHNDRSFYLTLTGLLEFAGGSIAGAARQDGADSGMKYIDYLKMLLFFGHSAEQDYRCMDIMQMNLRAGQKDFLMKRLIYSLEADVRMRTGHLFSGLGIVRAHRPDAGGSYTMEVHTAYSY